MQLDVRRAALQADLSEKKKRLAEQKHQTSERRRETVMNSVMALNSGSKDKAGVLRMFMWQWRSIIAGCLPGSMDHKLRMRHLLKTTTLFRASHWLLEATMRLWACISLQTLAQAASGEMLEQTLIRAQEAQKESKLKLHLAAGWSARRQTFMAWRRLHLQMRNQAEELQARQRWGMQEDAARRQFRRAEDQLKGFWSLTARRVTACHGIEALSEVFSAWAKEAYFGRAENGLVAGVREVQTMADVQRRFETIVCERWAERSLLLVRQARVQGELLALLAAWLFTARNERALRRKSRGHARAAAIARQRLASLNQSRTRTAFDSWQSAVCLARRLWIEKRCRWLEQSIGRSAAPQSRNSMPKEKPVPTPEDSGEVWSLTLSAPGPDTDFAARLGRFTFGMR